MSNALRVARRARLPDPVRLERYRANPSLGPRLLFFSGGTALREVSRRLTRYTHNSIHLITPFDSGGSSARLRRAFRMLAVGDLRNRLMALADNSVLGQPEIFSLFAYRFPRKADNERLRQRLAGMVDGRDRRIAAIGHPMRKIIRTHLRFFQEQMPRDFDLRGANIGNLILAGGYLSQSRHIDPVIYLFSKLVEVRGTVRPVTNRSLHLVAELRDGNLLVGQHLLSGKEEPPIGSPVARLFLSRKLRDPEPARVEVRRRVEKLIAEADLICYPMGSFYSSVIANLLVQGVAPAIAANDVPKVFVPNLGEDPEQLGLDLVGSIETLLDYLRQGCGEEISATQLLQYVLIDREAARADPEIVARVESLGVQPVPVPLVTEASQPLIDGEQLVQSLLSLT